MTSKTVVVATLCVTLVITVILVKQPPSTVSYGDLIEHFKIEGVPKFRLPVIRKNSDSDSAGPIHFELRSGLAKIIIVNFWATWCAPCVEELPSLLSLAGKFQPSDLLVVAISTDENEKEIYESLKRLNRSIPSNFVVLRDPRGTVPQEFGTKKIPESYIIGSDLKLVMKVISSQNWDTASVVEMIASRIKGDLP